MPVFLTVTVCDVVVPSGCGAKVNVFGVTVAAAVVETPVPVNVTIEGLVIPWIEMESWPV